MYLAIILFLTIISSTSCSIQGENKISDLIDPVSQKVVEDINSLGEVSLEDEELINNILETYKTLTDNQKEQVTNYIDLLKAQDTIIQLKKEQELEVIAEKEKYLCIEREYYPVVKNAIAKLKSECLFPNTLEIKEVIYYQYVSGSVYISYSAENKLGNAINGYYIYHANNDYGMDGAKYYNDIRQVAMEGNNKLPYEIGNYFYSDSENIEESTLFLFIIDLEDYSNN